MTGTPTPAVMPSRKPLPWRVVLRTRTRMWVSPGMPEEQATEVVAEILEAVGSITGPAMISFRTRHEVIAWIRAREIVSVESVNPASPEADERPPRPGGPS